MMFSNEIKEKNVANITEYPIIIERNYALYIDSKHPPSDLANG